MAWYPNARGVELLTEFRVGPLRLLGWQAHQPKRLLVPVALEERVEQTLSLPRCGGGGERFFASSVRESEPGQPSP